MLVNTSSIACAFRTICFENLFDNPSTTDLISGYIRPSKLNNDLSELPELTLDVKQVMFQTC